MACVGVAYGEVLPVFWLRDSESSVIAEENPYGVNIINHTLPLFELGNSGNCTFCANENLDLLIQRTSCRVISEEPLRTGSTEPQIFATKVAGWRNTACRKYSRLEKTLTHKTDMNKTCVNFIFL